MNVILIAVISLGHSAGCGGYSLRGFQEICRV